jgi:hypothetical protein
VSDCSAHLGRNEVRAHVRNREVRVENLVHTRKVELVEEEVAAAQRIAGRESAQ